MTMTALYALLSVFLISLISLAGLAVLVFSQKIIDRLLLVLVGLSAGALLGEAFLHLIPEALSKGGEAAMPFALAGIIIFFFLEKLFRWHHHHHGNIHCPTCGSLGERKAGRKHIGQLNLLSDLIHNFLDGLAIAAAYLVNFPLGLGTSIAVALHEIPQEIGDFGLLVHSGYSRQKALLLNFATSLSALLGALLALLAPKTGNLTNAVVPFIAGAFIYIAAADLIPELQRENKVKRFSFQFAAFIFGILLIAAL